MITELANRLGNERNSLRVFPVAQNTASDHPIAGTAFEVVAQELQRMGLDTGATFGGISQALGIEDLDAIGRGPFEQSVLLGHLADNLRGVIDQAPAMAA